MSALGPDMFVRWTSPARVSEGGCVEVPAALLANLVTVIDLADVHLSTDNRANLRIRGVGVDSSIPVVTNATAPSGFGISSDWSGQFRGADLITAFAQVRIAAARGEAKPVLTGVSAHFDGTTVVLAATDGTRLAERRVNAVSSIGGPVKIVVPARAVGEIEHLALGDDLVACSADATGKGLSVHGARCQIDVLGLDGTFPAYSQLIPLAPATSSIVAVDALLRRLAAVAMFSPDDVKRVTLQFRAKRGLTLMGKAADRGTGHAIVEATTSGVDTDAAINPDYLEAVLKVIGSDMVELAVPEDARILVVRPSPRFDYVYIVMPMVQ